MRFKNVTIIRQQIFITFNCLYDEKYNKFVQEDQNKAISEYIRKYNYDQRSLVRNASCDLQVTTKEVCEI